MSGKTSAASERIRITARIGQSMLLLLFVVFLSCGCRQEKSIVTLGGGPRGGTFENVSARLAEILNEEVHGVRVLVEPSGGSLANLIDVEQGTLSMGLAFSGDAFLGREGRLKEDLKPMTRVVALARLYGATAHLVVSESSIRDLNDLRGKRIAIGSSGSGSALSARRYFESIGLWENLIPLHVGYTTGIKQMEQGDVDAVWVQVGVPNEYLQEVSRHAQIRFLNITGAEESGFFSAYPFYSPTAIPAGTYYGQNQEILSFQDSALWVAGADLSEELVYRAMRAVFSEKGLKRMQGDPVTRDMGIATGLTGVKIPLHKGAERFWKEQHMKVDEKRPSAAFPSSSSSALRIVGARLAAPWAGQALPLQDFGRLASGHF